MNRTFSILDKKTFSPREELTINSGLLAELNLVNYIFVDVAVDGGEPVSCLLLSKDDVPRDSACLSKRAWEQLGEPEEAGLTFTAPDCEPVIRAIPKVDEIAQSYVKACPDLVRKYSEQVEIINPNNGFRVNLTLKADAAAKPGALYLNRYIMLLLGTKQDENYQIIITTRRPTRQTAPWLRKLKGWVIDSPLNLLGNLFIGKRELTLRVGYTYPFDEHQNLCRIHPNVRKLLGMEETDKIIVHYNGQEISVPVLDIDTENINEIINVNDQFIDSHFYIGISALSRNKLGIPNIGTSVIVKRSMYSLLLKHLNKLILPVIALLFTIMQLYKDLNWSILQTAIITVLMLPIIVFTSLSEERAKIK